MSDLFMIMQHLKPWTGRGPNIRYYDDFWVSNIFQDLDAYQKAHPECRVMDLARYGKVWYDTDARAHVDGITNPDLAVFITRTMERTQYLSTEVPPEHEFQAYDWTKLSESVPRNIVNYGSTIEPIWATVFHYKGRDFFVSHEYLTDQMESNRFVYRNITSGTIHFECEASDLWELVLELVNDRIKEDLQRKDEPMFNMFKATSINADGLNESTSHVNPPPVQRMEKRPDSPKNVPKVVLRRISDEELDRMRIEQIKDEARPRSRWNKADILENCSKVQVPEKSVDVLKCMTLKDILDSCLIYEGTDITGNEYDSMKQRHTKFYRLNYELITDLDK